MVELITAILAIFLYPVLWFGIRILPGEKWQFLATIPRRKNNDGSWTGLNLTYYGAITACSYVLSVVIFYFLANSQQLSIKVIDRIIVLLLAICMPAAKFIALLVEKKKHTFSVGGASFAGIIAAPWIVLGCNAVAVHWHKTPIPPLVVLAAISIAYAFGEGFGRLACLSFGCCYGKPLSQAPAWLQKLCCHHGLIFTGKTKKVSYAHGLDGQVLIPVQGITAFLYTTAGIIGFYLYLKGFTGTALMLTLAITQGWRFLSEFLRADYRGSGRISAYQIMSLISIIYTAVIILLLPSSSPGIVDIQAALHRLWTPGFLAAIQLLWIFSFLYSGCSRVTTARVNLEVLKDRV